MKLTTIAFLFSLPLAALRADDAPMELPRVTV